MFGIPGIYFCAPSEAVAWLNSNRGSILCIVEKTTLDAFSTLQNADATIVPWDGRTAFCTALEARELATFLRLSMGILNTEAAAVPMQTLSPSAASGFFSMMRLEQTPAEVAVCRLLHRLQSHDFANADLSCDGEFIYLKIKDLAPSSRLNVASAQILITATRGGRMDVFAGFSIDRSNLRVRLHHHNSFALRKAS